MQSLLSLHSFYSLSWLLTRVAEPVQAAWITHDRLPVERVNVEFYKAITTANENYVRYAVAASAHVRHMNSCFLKLAAKVQASLMVTHSLDGMEEAHVARGTLDPGQLITVVEQIRTDATSMCTAYQLPESHTLRFMLEAVQSGAQYGLALSRHGVVARGTTYGPDGSAPEASGSHLADARRGYGRHVLGLAEGPPLLKSAGRPQLEQFLSHVIQWSYNHQRSWATGRRSRLCRSGS